MARNLLPVTRDLVISRHRFRAYYDTWIGGHTEFLPVTGFLHAMALGLDACAQEGDLMNPSEDATAVALALAALVEPGRIISFFAAASGSGLFDHAHEASDQREERRSRETSSIIRALDVDPMAAVLDSGFQSGGMGGSGFEAMGNDAIWTDPGRILPAIVLARRRLCIVRVTDQDGNRQQGTGFLIGPSAILTCRHVVKNVSDHLSHTAGGSDPSAISCSFDFSHSTGLKGVESTDFTAQTEWRLKDSATGKARPLHGTPQWWMTRPVLDAWLADNDGKLDYAVIRLLGTPGMQRGWYDLTRLPTRRHDHAMTLHHPSGAKQTITFGPTKIKSRAPSRIFHQSATNQGSSGGLVLNEFGEPIGLHQAGEDFQVPAPIPGDNDRMGTEFMNIAVPMDLIAADIATDPTATQEIMKTTGLVPHRGCLGTNRPLFGRKGFLRDLNKMLEPDGPQVMLVHLNETDPAVSKPGMSFTIDIIRALLPPNEHHHIIFRAGEAETDAGDMARKMIRTVSPELEDKLPDNPDTTMAAFAQTLVALFGNVIEANLHNQTVWVMIDDLDKHGITDDSGREFLSTIYKKAADMPQVRIILIGLPEGVEISGLPDKIIRSHLGIDDLTKFDDQFAAWFQERLGREQPFDDAALDFISQTVVQVAGTTEPLPQMAKFVTSNIDPVAERFLKNQEEGAGQ